MGKSLLQSLNEKQVRAVTTSSQYCRVIAGAGSGKTRVLTNRFIYLIQELNYFPNQILAITFTNKAAKEIKDRIVRFLPDINERVLNVFTFHGFCARFLRLEIEHLNIPRSFVIIDEDDQKTILKRILKDEGYNAKSQMIKDLPGYISYQKNLGLYPEDVVLKSYNQNEKEKLRLYKLYQEELEKCDQLDFDDLLLKALEILKSFPEVREKWQHHFKAILIDEFQDTNDIQYELVKLMLDCTTDLYVVGDPDQTIYTWRGANQQILLDMKKTFPDIETIILEENYRSTSSILNSANRLIAYNKKRIPKNLFTHNGEGLPVEYNNFYDSYTEARFVVQKILELCKNNEFVYKDIVVMYRSSFLTLPFEKLLVQNQIPYVIYGGQKFYQRKEIKDILAYLRLLLKKNDNVSLERILNVPKRGIGDTSIERLRQEAMDEGQVYYDYLLNIDKQTTQIPTKALNAMLSVINLLDDLRKKMTEMPIGDFLSYMLEVLHYKEYLESTDDNADERMENVKTLISDINEVMRNDSGITLEDYLENIALMSSQDYVEKHDCLTLMTVHTAKGLEFPIVFVVGLNDGIFPSAKTVAEEPVEGLEEERRVCYVAFTRAMERLYVSSFYMNYNGQFSNPSIFIDEAGLKEKQRKVREENKRQESIYSFHQAQPKRPDVNKRIVMTNSFVRNVNNANNIKWQIGDRLKHLTFGNGVVIGVEDTMISVRFDDGNVKKLLGSHSSITKIERNENSGA